MQLLEAPQPGHQPQRRKRGHCTDRQALAALGRFQGMHRLVNLKERILYLGMKACAGSGQAHAKALALQQYDAQAVFKQPNLLAYRARRDM
ncbi:hypothetical protein D3C71_1765490 [compost metagenome]